MRIWAEALFFLGMPIRLPTNILTGGAAQRDPGLQEPARRRVFAFSVLILMQLGISTAPAQAKMVSIAAETANIRSGPGLEYDIYWQFGQGYPLLVLETRGIWLRVRDFENDVGWVHRSLTSRKPHLVVKKKQVNVRTGPGPGYIIVGQADYGVIFRTLDQRSGWARIAHEDGLVGWIRRDLLWGW